MYKGIMMPKANAIAAPVDNEVVLDKIKPPVAVASTEGKKGSL